MESSKENIQKVFNTFDKDGDGFIVKDEIKAMSVELGKEVTAEELDKIFKQIDINGDGKISFNEFYTWWHYGKENKLEELVFYKMKALKLLSSTQDRITKLGPLLESKYEKEFSEHFFSISVGNAPPKTTYGAKLLLGKSQIQHTQEVLKGLDISDKVPSLVFKIKSNEAEKAKEGFQNIFEQVISMAESMLPEEITKKFLPSLKFSYAIPEPNYVVVGISFDNEIVGEVTGMYMGMVEQFLSDEQGSSVHFQISSGTTMKEIAANKSKKVTDILGKGLTLSLDLKLNQGLLAQVRAMVQGMVMSNLAKNPQSKKSNDLKKLMLLLQLDGSKIALNFKTFEEAIAQILPLPPLGTVKELSDSTKESFHPAEMISSLPLCDDVIDVFKNFCETDFSLTLQMPKVAVNIYQTGEGLSDMFRLFAGDGE